LPVIISVKAENIGQLGLAFGSRRVMGGCCHDRTPLLVIFIEGIQGAFALFKPLGQQVQVFNGGF
jgi:hypothetical protein